MCAKLYWSKKMSTGSAVIMITTYCWVCNIMDIMCVKTQKKGGKGIKLYSSVSICHQK